MHFFPDASLAPSRRGNLKRYWLGITCLLLSLIMLGVLASCTTHSTSTTYKSGGLGLTKREWEQQHTLISSKDYYYDRYVNPLQPELKSPDLHIYWVTYWAEPGQREQIGDDARTSRIVVNAQGIVRPDESLTQDRFHAIVLTLLPTDAEFLKTETKLGSPERPIFETYHSKSLETIYPAISAAPDPWYDAIPGEITVTYHSGSKLAFISAGPTGQPPYSSPASESIITPSLSPIVSSPREMPTSSLRILDPKRVPPVRTAPAPVPSSQSH